MNTPTKISALQFYMTLFLSRSVITLTINSQTVGEVNFLDNILSAVLYAVLLFLFSFPLFRLNKNYAELSVPDIAAVRWGNIGLIAALIYAVYFLIMNTHSLALFLTLLTNTMDPTASKWSIVLVITAIALYGAVKGIETVSRAAICISALFLLGFAVLFMALIPRVNWHYAEPLLYDGTEQMVNGVHVLVSRCTSLAEFAVLMPFVKQNLRRGFSVWNSGVAVFVSVLLVFLVTCLGEYAYIQIFPVYTLATMAEIAGIQRLDAMLVGLSMMALVIRLSCGLFAISASLNRIIPRDKRKYPISAAALISAIGALWLTERADRIRLLFDNNLLFATAVLVNVLLPLFICLADSRRRKRI